MKSVQEIEMLRNVPELFFPVMWFDQSAQIDDVWTKKFKNMVQTPFLLVDIFTYLGISVGVLGVIFSIILFTC